MGNSVLKEIICCNPIYSATPDNHKKLLPVMIHYRRTTKYFAPDNNKFLKLKID